MLKRSLDILLSLAALLVLAPLCVGIAVAVRVTSRGPALFRQERAGLHGRPFTLHKFRTMKATADPFGPSPHGHDDPRLTRVGRFLRETSLDELPQLVNVLKGDMSLVGPRPLYRAEMAEWDPRQIRRLEVRPGLTGLAQIAGRGGLTRERKLELDVRYVETACLGLDLKVLLATIGLVFRREAVYERQTSQIEETRAEVSRTRVGQT